MTPLPPTSPAGGRMRGLRPLLNRLAVLARRLRPSSFRAKVTLAVALTIIVMMTALIVAQNIIVTRTAARQNEMMSLCMNYDGSVSVSTGKEYSDAAPTGDIPMACYSGTRGNLEGATLYSPANTQEWDDVESGASQDKPLILDKSNGVILSTANAVTDSLTGMMRTVSIVMLALFGLIAVGAAWFIGTVLSRRVTAVDRQVAALQPDDLSARLDVKPGHDDIDRLVESINGMLDRVQASSEAERRFVSNASHELRTPIAAVETNLDAPLAQGRFPKDVEPSVRRALAANRRGAALVQALLTLSRIQSGAFGGAGDGTGNGGNRGSSLSVIGDRTITDGTAAANLNDCVDAALEDIGADVREHSVTVQVDRPDSSAGPVTVPVNPSLLALAVGNLIRNAAVHNVQDGSIKIAIDADAGTDADGNGKTTSGETTDGDTVPRMTAHGGTIALTVTNTTDETLPDDLDDLMQPFHRGTNSRISAVPGVGLGLSIAEAACKAMGAALELGRTEDGRFRATILF
ncbi:two-component system sensor histidine kinase [Bifidobacterium myosotis]|uniref:histidine kinase n=1 Tax=Bifidobacterium myosotis TaxID=1630166 RepID=A0A261FE94_9BIFI|nr:HAMP domain-containing sensor histidine kinase [Bifidobacterium myosotis]OZG57469.1 two-component system sensor histidine kinase [Bifidobacterium myosotis]